jgi:hypothetical protein
MAVIRLLFVYFVDVTDVTEKCVLMKMNLVQVGGQR